MSQNNRNPNFSKGENNLLPAIVQDAHTEKVLMLGYMNQEALAVTQETGKVTFYSRSKGRLWTKGESSGNFLHFKRYLVDCDEDTLLIYADPQGPTCHTGTATCFGEFPNEAQSLAFLENIIKDRKNNPQEGSYTNKLLGNLNKAAQKVGEEAVELVIEAKDDNKDLFLNEAADLMYHYLVLLTAKGFSLHDVLNILREREK